MSAREHPSHRIWTWPVLFGVGTTLTSGGQSQPVAAWPANHSWYESARTIAETDRAMRQVLHVGYSMPTRGAEQPGHGTGVVSILACSSTIRSASTSADAI